MQEKITPFGLPALYDSRGIPYTLSVFHGTDTSALPEILSNGLPAVESGRYYGQQYFLDRFFDRQKITPAVLQSLKELIPKFAHQSNGTEKQGVFYEFSPNINTFSYARAAAKYSGGGEFMTTAIDLLDMYFKSSLTEITAEMPHNKQIHLDYLKKIVPIIHAALKPEFQDIASFKECAVRKYSNKSKPIIIEFKIPVTELIKTDADFHRYAQHMTKRGISAENTGFRLFGVNNSIKGSVPASDITAIYECDSCQNDCGGRGQRFTVDEFITRRNKAGLMQNAADALNNNPPTKPTSSLFINPLNNEHS